MNCEILTSLYYFDPVQRRKLRWVWLRGENMWCDGARELVTKIEKSINWMWTAPSGWDLILILDWLPLKLSFPDFRLTLNNETDQRKWILILSGKKKGWPKPIWVKPFDPTKLGQRKTSENVKGFLNGKGLTDQTWSVLIQNDPLRSMYWARPGSAKNSLKIFIKTYAFMDTMFVPYLKLGFIFHFLW